MSPKTLLPLLLLSAFLSLNASADVPRGDFVELHSCEVLAGSCVVNGEIDQAGNYLLRAWRFDSGYVNGVSLNGLTVALLEKGDNTLALAKNPASDAVAYLPAGLTPGQRAALLAWARQNTSAPLAEKHVKVAALDLQLAFDQVRFSAGTDVAFDGAKPIPCGLTGCGEMLWYQPRGGASSFTVDQLGVSRIIEPALALHWQDHDRKTLFVGRFGDPEVTVPTLCGAATTNVDEARFRRN